MEDKRLIANKAYSAGNFLEAVELYSSAILEAKPSDPELLCILHSNRAAALLKCNPPQWANALKDCNVALSLNGLYTKVFFC